MELSFVLPWDPISKGRPRTGRSGGRPFTPKRTRDAEKRIREYVEPLIDVPADTPVTVWLEFYCETRRRTDLDNMEKLVCDALNGIAWVDDHLIHEKHSRLHRRAIGEEPRTIVRIESLPHP